MTWGVASEVVAVQKSVEVRDLLLLAAAVVELRLLHLGAGRAERTVDREAVERPADLGGVAVGGGADGDGLREEARRREVVVVVAGRGVARAEVERGPLALLRVDVDLVAAEGEGR